MYKNQFYGGVSVIEFTIVDAGNTTNVLGTYQCEDGMTWQEFIDSKYNINKNFYIYENYVTSQKRGTIRIPLDYVLPNDIVKNQTYIVPKNGILSIK